MPGSTTTSLRCAKRARVIASCGVARSTTTRRARCSTAADLIAAVEVNVSCPNLPGAEIFSHDPERRAAVDAVVGAELGCRCSRSCRPM